MSKYTTQVRYICENAAGLLHSAGFDDVNRIITAAAPKIFDFDWPIFDENYRLPLEIKILRHFYTREICEETVGLWKLRLQDKLQLIMPYYNKLYNSELIEFNPLYDVDYQKSGSKTGSRDSTDSAEKNRTESKTGTITKSGTDSIDDQTTTETTGTISDAGTVTTSGTIGDVVSGQTSDTTTTSGEKWDLYNDTPQGSIQNIAITDNSYLTNARKNTDDTTDTTTSTNSTTATKTTDMQDSKTDTKTYDTAVDVTRDYEKTASETENENRTITNAETASKTANIETLDEYTEHVQGKTSGISYSKMLAEFRDTFLNIDRMVIQELEMLFFGLWE